MQVIHFDEQTFSSRHHLDCRVFQCLLVFPLANTISDGDKESECDEDGPNPEDSRKVMRKTLFVMF